VVTNVVSSLIGTSGIIETAFTIANNQSSPSDITGLLFDPSTVRSFIVEYSLYRNTTGSGATERAECGFLSGSFLTVQNTCDFNSGSNVIGDAGVTFTITEAGQVQYISDNQSGTPASSKMKFRAKTFAVA
jgi:hypothetical protein